MFLTTFFIKIYYIIYENVEYLFILLNKLIIFFKKFFFLLIFDEQINEMRRINVNIL